MIAVTYGLARFSFGLLLPGMKESLEMSEFVESEHVDQFRNKFWYRLIRVRCDFINAVLEADLFYLCDLNFTDFDLEF